MHSRPGQSSLTIGDTHMLWTIFVGCRCYGCWAWSARTAGRLHPPSAGDRHPDGADPADSGPPRRVSWAWAAPGLVTAPPSLRTARWRPLFELFFEVVQPIVRRENSWRTAGAHTRTHARRLTDAALVRVEGLRNPRVARSTSAPQAQRPLCDVRGTLHFLTDVVVPFGHRRTSSANPETRVVISDSCRS